MSKRTKPKLSKLHDKDWEKLTDAEREQVFNDLDALGPRLVELSRPLTKRERVELEALPTKEEYERRGRGRPKLGGVGAKHVNLTIAPILLKRTDAAAKRKGLSRSALISHAIEQLLKAG